MTDGLRTLFRKFCLEGTVLGLKYFYLFPDKYSRCFWLVWVTSILYFSGLLAFLLYQRFEANPTRITIENQFEPVADMPYPAITLCTPNQMTISAVRHFDKSLVNGNRSFDLTNTLRQLLGFYHFVHIDLDELAHLQKLIELNRYTVPEVMALLPQSCDRFLRLCIFRKRPYPRCRGLFRPVLTKHGLCCIFNSGYHYKTNHRNELDPQFRPHQVGLTDITGGLSVITDYEPSDAVDHTIHYAGATRVMFTDWTEFPSDDEAMLLAPATESFHSIHITATYCSSDVQELPSHSRQCLFEHERPLQFFRKYRNSDCDLLCLVHAVERHCQCLLVFLPHLRVRETCGATSLQCIAETKLNLNLEEQDCVCPRDCDSRVYKVDTSIGNLQALPYLLIKTYESFNMNKSSSIMRFVFPTTVYKKQKQETIMSLTTLVSNLGGVFGLCLGCSVMSVLEILFFNYRAARNCAAPPRRRRATGPPRYYE